MESNGSERTMKQHNARKCYQDNTLISRVSRIYCMKKLFFALAIFATGFSARAQQVVKFVSNSTSLEFEIVRGDTIIRCGFNRGDTLILQSDTASGERIVKSHTEMKAILGTKVQGNGAMLTPYRFSPGVLINIIHLDAVEGPKWKFVGPTGKLGWQKL
jgi:hypothetical protein